MPQLRRSKEFQSAVTYSGTGGQHNSGGYPQASNADISYTNHLGDTASFGFTGSQISWVAEPGANQGEADVIIDGSFVTRVDLYRHSGCDWFRSVVLRKSPPSTGTGTITITVVGKNDIPSTDNYVTLDAFAVS